VKQCCADVQLACVCVCEGETSAMCIFSVISVFGKSAVHTAALTRPAPHPSVPCLCSDAGRYHCDKSPSPPAFPPSRAVLCLPVNGPSKVPLLGKVVN
jgi:hypothetical protein